MKAVILLSVLCVVAQYNGVSAGVRVVRDAPEAMDAEPAHKDGPNLEKILEGALKRVAAKAKDNEELKKDVEKLQAALASGELKESLMQVKADVAKDHFELRKVITALRERAPEELKESVSRIIAASQGALEKIHQRAHQLEGRLDERLKAAADDVAAAAAAPTA